MFLGVLNFGLVLFPKKTFLFFNQRKNVFNKDDFVPQEFEVGASLVVGDRSSPAKV